MFNNKTITMMRKLLSEAFPNIEEHERKKMLETLINKHPNSRLFCTMNGKHIARVGVEYPLDENSKARFYYVTEYDNEMLDL
jgi:hypothetical protein